MIKKMVLDRLQFVFRVFMLLSCFWLFQLIKPNVQVHATVNASDITNFDIRTKNSDGVTADKINNYLKNGWGKGTGDTIMSASKKYGINAAFLVGQMQAENGINTKASAHSSITRDNNVTGIKGDSSNVDGKIVVGTDNSMTDGTHGGYLKYANLATGMDQYFKTVYDWSHGKAPHSAINTPYKSSLTNLTKFASVWTGHADNMSTYYSTIAKVFNDLGQSANGALASGDNATSPTVKVTGSKLPATYNPFTGYPMANVAMGVEDSSEDVSNSQVMAVDSATNLIQPWVNDAVMVFAIFIFVYVTVVTVMYMAVFRGFNLEDAITKVTFKGFDDNWTIRKGIVSIGLVSVMLVVVLSGFYVKLIAGIYWIIYQVISIV